MAGGAVRVDALGDGAERGGLLGHGRRGANF